MGVQEDLRGAFVRCQTMSIHVTWASNGGITKVSEEVEIEKKNQLKMALCLPSDTQGFRVILITTARM